VGPDHRAATNGTHAAATPRQSATAAPSAGLSLHLDPAALGPLIRQVVEATLLQLEQARAAIGDRLAYSEAEAARLLGLAPHQLRDERLRGRIAASQVVGRRVRYLRDDLIRYLMARRTGSSE
jgi:hypothetical protein